MTSESPPEPHESWHAGNELDQSTQILWAWSCWSPASKASVGLLPTAKIYVPGTQASKPRVEVEEVEITGKGRAKATAKNFIFIYLLGFKIFLNLTSISLCKKKN